MRLQSWLLHPCLVNRFKLLSVEGRETKRGAPERHSATFGLCCQLRGASINPDNSVCHPVKLAEGGNKTRSQSILVLSPAAPAATSVKVADDVTPFFRSFSIYCLGLSALNCVEFICLGRGQIYKDLGPWAGASVGALSTKSKLFYECKLQQ